MLDIKVAGLVAAMAVASCTGVATAHVTVQPTEAVAGSYLHMDFSVPHGCQGSSTVALRVKVPDGVLSAKPQMKPGWTVDIKKKKLDTPQSAGHGHMISEVVDEITWRGGPLPDSLYDTFGLIVKLPDTPGQTVYFPAVQECEKGVSRWIELPAAGQSSEQLQEPAPFIKLKPPTP
jgi:periplasmic copper chaperone A